MTASIIEFLSYPFIQRALLAGIVIGIATALLGVFVTIRQMSFYADAISHAALAGIALGLLLKLPPFWAAVGFCILLSIVTVALKQRSRVATDTVMGILFSGGIALGLVLLSQLQGFRADLFGYLFGDILALTWDDVILASILSIAICIFVFASGKRLLLTSFSADFSFVRGINEKRLEYIFFIVTAITIALGIKIMGIVLITGLLILPAAVGKNLAHTFKQLVYFAILTSIIATLSGIILSYTLDWPSGPSIILVNVGLFIVSLLVQPRR